MEEGDPAPAGPPSGGKTDGAAPSMSKKAAKKAAKAKAKAEAKAKARLEKGLDPNPPPNPRQRLVPMMESKRAALEDVLIPETVNEHRDRLLRAGFSSAAVWLRYFNFVSIIAIR